MKSVPNHQPESHINPKSSMFQLGALLTVGKKFSTACRSFGQFGGFPDDSHVSWWFNFLCSTMLYDLIYLSGIALNQEHAAAIENITRKSWKEMEKKNPQGRWPWYDNPATAGLSYDLFLSASPENTEDGDQGPPCWPRPTYWSMLTSNVDFYDSDGLLDPKRLLNVRGWQSY